MKVVEIETSPVTTIGIGVETRTIKHQITPHSNEQTNQSTVGHMAYVITNREHAAKRRWDIRIMRRWKTGWGVQTLFVCN